MDHLDVKRILKDIEYPGVTFIMGRFKIDPPGNIHSFVPGPLYLQVKGTVIDRDTGQDTVVRGRKYVLSSHMTTSEVVQTAFMAVKQFQEHELRESFRYRGQLVFNPHLDLDELADEMDRGHIPESVRTSPEEPNSLEREIPTNSPFYEKLLSEREGGYLENIYT